MDKVTIEILGTDSTPTGSRYVISTPHESVDGRPCYVSKTYTRSNSKAIVVDNLLRKKKIRTKR